MLAHRRYHYWLVVLVRFLEPSYVFLFLSLVSMILLFFGRYPSACRVELIRVSSCSLYSYVNLRLRRSVTLNTAVRNAGLMSSRAFGVFISVFLRDRCHSLLGSLRREFLSFSS